MLRGKRIPAAVYRQREHHGFAFCDAALTWDHGNAVHDELSISGADTGYPDILAVPDTTTARPLPWRAGAVLVLSDLRDESGDAVETAPRSVLRRVVDHLAALGFTAEVGLELEFHLLGADGLPLAGFTQCYSLERLNDLDPAFSDLFEGVSVVADVEGETPSTAPGSAN